MRQPGCGVSAKAHNQALSIGCTSVIYSMPRCNQLPCSLPSQSLHISIYLGIWAPHQNLQVRMDLPSHPHLPGKQGIQHRPPCSIKACLCCCKCPTHALACCNTRSCDVGHKYISQILCRARAWEPKYLCRKHCKFWEVSE